MSNLKKGILIVTAVAGLAQIPFLPNTLNIVTLVINVVVFGWVLWSYAQEGFE